jgi:hypothetical protein
MAATSQRASQAEGLDCWQAVLLLLLMTAWARVEQLAGNLQEVLVWPQQKDAHQQA